MTNVIERLLSPSNVLQIINGQHGFVFSGMASLLILVGFCINDNEQA